MQVVSEALKPRNKDQLVNTTRVNRTHGAYICITKTIQGVLVSSLCNFCIHMSHSEQPCRVSWVPSEASSWAEYEHKWCFHSALLSAVWILPQALISMAAAFSHIPGLCYCMCVSARTHTHSLSYLLKPPSQLQLNPPVYVLFPQLDFSPLFTPPYRSPSGSHPRLFSNYLFFSGSLLFFQPSSLSHFLQSLSHVWWSSPPALFPLISSCIPLIECQLLHFPSPYLAHPCINQEWMVVREDNFINIVTGHL